MEQIFINLALFLLGLTIILVLFLGLIWFGFRMGRQSIDKPLAPIITPKQEQTGEQDEYFEALHGIPAPRVPTVGR